MSKRVVVLALKCYFDKDSWRTYGPRLVERQFESLSEATAFAEEQRAPQMAVILRPSYNEVDDKGDYFREWRSFDGSPLKETRWPVASSEMLPRDG